MSVKCLEVLLLSRNAALGKLQVGFSAVFRELFADFEVELSFGKKKIKKSFPSQNFLLTNHILKENNFLFCKCYF